MATIEDLIYIRNPAVTETTLDDDVFLVEPGSGEVFYLNAVTGGLWTLFAQAATEADAQATYRAAFPENPDDEVSRDVAGAIAEMRSRDLIVPFSTGGD